MSVSRIVAVVGMAARLLAGAPVAAAQPPDDVGEIDDYPIAQGTFTTPDDFYFVYFKTPDGRSCGIGPNGGPVGCDAVPKDAPEGTNQTVVNPWAPAEYRHSDTTSVTRHGDVLPESYPFDYWASSC